MAKFSIVWTVDSTGEFIQVKDSEGITYFCDLDRMHQECLDLLALTKKMKPGTSGHHQFVAKDYVEWVDGAPAVHPTDNDYARLVGEFGRDALWD